jgi:2-keto-4-pentenoate hydratase/2-oxohepta-3-ene-1,7-dioic acid hydratase in catechol pathway
MRLVTFAPKKGEALRVGLVNERDEVVDLTRVRPSPPFDPRDMVSLIEAGAAALRWLRGAAARARPGLPLGRVRLAAPIPRPRKNIFCVGWNYLDHFKEGEKSRREKVDLPEHPAFFTKATTTVTGPYDPIPYDPKISEKMDWEGELALVIGRRGRDIAEDSAMRYVFGYTVVNDVTARDLQRRHNQWFKGKSLDGCCPMGPWIVTAEAVPDPHDLRVTTRVNGVVKQDSSTSYFYFKLPRVIAELSLGTTLEPGDVIATGTPSGVGYARTPPEFLRPGDVLETEISGIGALRNRIGK